MSRERGGCSNVTEENAGGPGHDPAAGALWTGMVEASDEQALAWLRQRDERGFALAYARYAESVFGFLVRLSRSRPAAEDLFQHTFLRLAECGAQLRAGSDLRAWLFSVARNAFHSQLRRRGTEARSALQVEPANVRADEPESGLALDDLERALASLAVEDRELLLLIGVEGLSYAQLADVLGAESAIVRKRVSRARARLARALDVEGALGQTTHEANDRAR